MSDNILEENDLAGRSSLSGDARAILDGVKSSLSLGKQSVDSGSTILSVTLAEQLYRRAPEDYLLRRSPGELAKIVTELREQLALHISENRHQTVKVWSPETGDRNQVSCLLTILDDRPFVIDTLSGYLAASDLPPDITLHPILKLSSGRLLSLVYFELSRANDPNAEQALEHRVSELLNLLRDTTDDYPLILTHVEEAITRIHSANQLSDISQTQRDETAKFLKWLADGGFVFLGYREWLLANSDTWANPSDSTVVKEKSLGLFRSPPPELHGVLEGAHDDAQFLVDRKTLMHFSTLLGESPIHRRVKMEIVFIKTPNPEGGLILSAFLGVPTSRAMLQETSSVPVIRRKLQKLIESEGVSPNTHNYKEIIAFVDSTPKAVLLRHSLDILREDLRLFMELQQRSEIRVTLHPDPLNRLYTAMVVMPRERYGEEIAREIQHHLERTLNVLEDSSEFRVAITDDRNLRIYYLIPNPTRHLVAVDLPLLEEQLANLTRSWEDALDELLEEEFGGSTGVHLSKFYHSTFPERYQASTSPETAVQDIKFLETLSSDTPLAVSVRESRSGYEPDTLSIKIYRRGGGLTLSSIVPILENCGFEILSETTTTLTTQQVLWATIYDVYVKPKRWGASTVLSAQSTLLPGLTALLLGNAENDKFNSLLIDPGMSLEQITILRTVARYLKQIRAFGSEYGMSVAFSDCPQPSGILIDYFINRFDPTRFTGDETARSARLIALEEDFKRVMKDVTELQYDRILWSALNVINATVRTNYFLNAHEALGLKIDCKLISRLPAPRPLFEIFMSAPGFDAVHLRGGKVARGGIRWSERPDDFRTEVLGLMKTQMVKNSIIVPVGAKGGFVLRKAPNLPPSTPERVKDCYRSFIRTLLQLTDNISADNRIVPPPSILRYDADDPYLVVAADKGTATYSDTANGIAVNEFKFWLGDAFASGGSQGYDHKKFAITARGAWEATRRHFREAGIDVDKELFTAIGIGDMAGDVFGNGLLLSKNYKLIAAFNHKHIFIDPNPDPQQSFTERKRLFELPGSQWSDYSKEVLSKGGGIYLRNLKEISLSEEAQEALGTERMRLSGEELIRVILSAPVDLLWNGGIGTYVKSASEDHIAVSDKTNDGVRIDASELRAKIVGEGGNLGFTQLARIDYALNGGRINTDAIDNSGGVDMSDHEVNLKILLDAIVARGALSTEERNSLLASLAADVSHRVTEKNRIQSESLSLGVRRSRQSLSLYRQLLQNLDRTPLFNRKLEQLPDNDTLLRRAQNKLGLTRPELAVIKAHVKMLSFDLIRESSLPDEPFVEHYLLDYFPDAIVSRFAADIRQHRLRKEIIATQLANTVVERLGVGFLARVIGDSPSSAVKYIAAGLIAEEVLDSETLLNDLSTLDRAGTTNNFLECSLRISRALDGIARFIRERTSSKDSAQDLISRFQAPLQKLLLDTRRVLPARERTRIEANIMELRERGVPDRTAEAVSALAHVVELMDVIELSNLSKRPLEEVTELYFAASAELHMGRLLDGAQTLECSDPTEEAAIRRLTTSLRRALFNLCQQIIEEKGAGSLDSLNSFLGERTAELSSYHQALAECLGTPLAPPSSINANDPQAAKSALVSQAVSASPAKQLTVAGLYLVLQGLEGLGE